jgi:hypothetical protein
MLQKTYSIYSDDLNDVQLFIEAGKNHIACWCKKKDEKALRAFEFFLCDRYTAENLEELIDNTRSYSRLLTMPVSSTNFFWNTDEVLCVPPEKNNSEFLKANFELLFGNSVNSKIFSASAEQCFVTWRIESEQQHIGQECFRGSVFNHQYVSLLPSLKLFSETAVYLFFYPHYFTLIGIKNNDLQFAQTRKYNTPEDVLYFILNACKQYDFKINVEVFCGGFIDEKSKLYEMLYQYLEGLELMQADETRFAAGEFKEYSSHYFMPYINYVV